MNNILEKITQTKYIEVQQAKEKINLAQIKTLATNYIKQYKTRDFVAAIQAKHSQNLPAVIAEIKQASPSKGIICTNFAVEKIAHSYEKHGAACLSVLTDEKYFKGSEEYLKLAHKSCSLPILRKDFIIDEYQIYQSCLMGADAILLIASILDAKQMQDFTELAHSLNLAVLPEIHHSDELDKALDLQTPLIGINNRNLSTFEVSLEQTINLLPSIHNKIIVTESGILNKKDVELMHSHKVNTFLVGEAFMKQDNCGVALENMFF